MKILYIANHNQVSSNDDEGAIADALTRLGHTVVCAPEADPSHDIDKHWNADLVLSHKWADPQALYRLKRAKKVCWWFDRVNGELDDPTLARRNAARMDWFRKMTPHINLGFCSDGDWVDADRTEKMVYLSQGADDRIAGTDRTVREKRFDILFVGNATGGVGRKRFVREMQTRWGKRFHHVPQGIYQERLRHLVALSRVVVAPPTPCSDRYWSNRVYIMLGFGAFLLHPRCGDLRFQYEDGKELLTYNSMGELHDILLALLAVGEDDRRGRIAAAGLGRTLRDHTYLRRCETLLETLRLRLGLR